MKRDTLGKLTCLASTAWVNSGEKATCVMETSSNSDCHMKIFEFSCVDMVWEYEVRDVYFMSDVASTCPRLSVSTPKSVEEPRDGWLKLGDSVFSSLVAAGAWYCSHVSARHRKY